MKNQLKSWAEKTLPQDVNQLISDAILSYEQDTYTQAFHLSYKAWITTIAQRLLASPRPSAVSEQCWQEDIREPLQDKNHWEYVVSYLIQSTKDRGKDTAGVFDFDDCKETIREYQYWKAVRDRCRLDDNAMTKDLLEKFWQYLLDEMEEFYVGGGIPCLYEQLVYAYQQFDTVGEAFLKQTLRDIAIVFHDNAEICFEVLSRNESDFLAVNEKNMKFWGIILESKDSRIRRAFAQFLFINKKDLEPWYQQLPNLAAYVREEIGRSVCLEKNRKTKAGDES